MGTEVIPPPRLTSAERVLPGRGRNCAEKPDTGVCIPFSHFWRFLCLDGRYSTSLMRGGLKCACEKLPGKYIAASGKMEIRSFISMHCLLRSVLVGTFDYMWCIAYALRIRRKSYAIVFRRP